MGILNPFYEAVAWVLMRIHALLSVPFGPASGWAWGLSIVFLVMVMRLIMVPLFVKQMHSQRKMAALAPQVAALRKKYKNDKQTMNQEVMKLYQANGANPLAGCLPLVIQLPVFFALFNVLRAIAEDKTEFGLTPAVVFSAQHAHIFTATIADRIVTSPLPPYHLAPGPASAKIVIGIFVLISSTTTFLTVRQSVKRGIGQVGQDPNNPMANSQKYMMYIAPLFALSGLYWQFGLVLYWCTTNVWTLGQQYILFRNFAPITAGADAESATAPAAKGTAGPAGTTVSKNAAAKPPSRGTAAKASPAKSTAAKATRSRQRRPEAARPRAPRRQRAPPPQPVAAPRRPVRRPEQRRRRQHGRRRRQHGRQRGREWQRRGREGSCSCRERQGTREDHRRPAQPRYAAAYGGHRHGGRVGPRADGQGRCDAGGYGAPWPQPADARQNGA